MLAERWHKVSKKTYQVFLGSIVLVLFTLTGCATTSYHSSTVVQTEVDDVQYLSSYGEWEYIQPFGMVWLPDVVSDWGPFYHGHWIWTNDGWAWTSYEPYGWLVYHYGYWGYRPGIGWFWVPEDIWWPARVQWYTFGNYTAWAPLPPPGIAWRDPWDPYDINVWIVVNIDNFTNENIGRHRVRNLGSREVVKRQTVIKHPPEIRQVERRLKTTVPKRKIRKEVITVRPKAASASSKSAKTRESKLERIVLPKTEKRKVERNTTRVKREVLTPKKAERAPANKSQEKKREAPKRKARG